MPPDDPFTLIVAWILCLLALARIIRILREGKHEGNPQSEAQSGWRKLKESLLPLGILCFAGNFLLAGYGYLPPGGVGQRLLYALATLGIVGGVAATRIRRIPD